MGLRPNPLVSIALECACADCISGAIVLLRPSSSMLRSEDCAVDGKVGRGGDSVDDGEDCTAVLLAVVLLAVVLLAVVLTAVVAAAS